MLYHKYIKRLVFIFGIMLITSNAAMAKDLTSRLGVGYTNQFVSGNSNLPSISARYYPSPQLGLSAAIGVDTEENNSKFGFMVKLYRIIFMEDNMNFYMGTGVGLVSLETAGENSSGFELNGFVGAEYFFTGLDSLGFSFEAGIGVASVSSEVRFKTIGDHPLRAGIIFYF